MACFLFFLYSAHQFLRVVVFVQNTSYDCQKHLKNTNSQQRKKIRRIQHEDQSENNEYFIYFISNIIKHVTKFAVDNKLTYKNKIKQFDYHKQQNLLT